MAVVDTERGHRGSKVEQKLMLLDITMIENKLWLILYIYIYFIAYLYFGKFHLSHLYIKGRCNGELLTPVTFAKALLHLALHKAV